MPDLGGPRRAAHLQRRPAGRRRRSSSSDSNPTSRRSCERRDDRRSRRPSSRYGGEHAIRTEDLGVRYDLRFNKKTTIRQSLGQMLGRGTGAGLLGAPPRLAPGRPRRVARRHRAERRRQEHAPPGPRRDHPPVRGRRRRPRPRLGTADARRRLRPRSSPGRDNILLGGAFLGLDDCGHARAAAIDRRVRRPRRLHRRPAQDLLVGDARAARVRDRDVGRPGHPAARRSPRHGRRDVPREVEGPGHRDRQGRQGRRARHPRHELGHRVLQPGDPHRERPDGHGGRTGRRRRDPPRAHRGAAKAAKAAAAKAAGLDPRIVAKR